MIKFIDDFLNNITMYRLVLYVLIFLIGISVIFSFEGLLPFSPFSIILTTVIITFFCICANIVFSSVYKSQTNLESVYITALILALIISPIKTGHDLLFLGWVSIWAMASKYIFAIGKKHLFNPAAFAVALTAIGINQTASWWIGTGIMMPFVLLSGLLIVRKIRRLDMVISFFVSALLTIFVFGFFKGLSAAVMVQKALLDSALLFFAFIMLTEPLTTPPTKNLQIIYGMIVGFLFAPQIHIGDIYSTPELALIAGNVFSYIVSPKYKLILALKDKIQVAPGIYDFVFGINKRLAFSPGQYMEWTLGQEHPDIRGNRRYFTIASSPTENTLRIGVRFYQPSSSFKQSLLSMDREDEIVASGLAGDFTLSDNPNQKLVFIAGGIGITPFRSMIKYLTDINQKRDIVLIYANRTASEMVYRDIFDSARESLGIKVFYVLSDSTNIPSSWEGETGRIDEQMIKRDVPDYMDRVFYLSGPHSMVAAFEDTLNKMGVRSEQIKTDYFPGFA